MCGRYYRRSDKQRIAEAFRLGQLLDGFVLPQDFNIAPSTVQPVIRLNRDTNEREIVMMRWGLVPYFAKSQAEFKGVSMINAKAETVTSKSLWRGLFEKRRCLVPATASTNGRASMRRRRSLYASGLKDGLSFAFAGLWDAWKDPANGEWLQTFSIITTDPNEVAAEVHTRMPVILHARDYDRWLTRGLNQPPIDLLRPYEAEAMTMDACNPLVGKPLQRNGHRHGRARPLKRSQLSQCGCSRNAQTAGSA